MHIGEQKKLDTAYAMARFAATGTAVLIAAMHRGKPVTDSDVKHLLGVLASCAAEAPDEAEGAFQKLAELAAGKHYEGG